MQRFFAVLIILGLLLSVLPAPAAQAQEALPTVTSEPKSIEEVREINRLQMQAGQSRTVEALTAVPKELYPLATASGCWYISLTSDQSPPAGSTNVEQRWEASPHGEAYYQGGFGHSKLAAWPQAGLPEDWILFKRVVVRNKSKLKTRIALVEIQENGEPLDNVDFFDVPADGQWHIFEGPASETGIYVTNDEDQGIRLQYDALSIIGCDPTFTFLPALQMGQGSQSGNPPLDCGDGNTGRWRVGSETNEDIERSQFLVPGAVWSHSENGQHACWAKVQTKAKNWSTGVILDFQGQDRSSFDRKLLIPMALISGAALPSWASGIAALTEGTAAFVGGTGLLVASGWAAIFGIGVGGAGYVGWRAHIAEMELRGESTLHPPFVTEYKGRLLRTTYLIDPEELFSTYLHMYRIQDGLNPSGTGYEDWVEEGEILGYLTFQENQNGRPEGFFYTQQYEKDFSVADRRYKGEVIERAGEIFGERAIDEGGWIDIGPIKDTDAKETLDSIERMLEQREPIPYDPDNPNQPRCLVPITNGRVVRDLRHYVAPIISAELYWELVGRLEAYDQAETRYEHRKSYRFIGTSSVTHFFAEPFSDGELHVTKHRCVPHSGDGMWMFEDLYHFHLELPYRWEE